MEFYEKLKNYRKKNNMSQEELAEILNVSRQAITKWESGETLPDTNHLVNLSNIFQVSIDHLLKNDTCGFNNLEKDLEWGNNIEFLIRAKQNTYAGNGEELKDCLRPNSHDFIYQEGDLKYIDTYLGGKRFIGEEAMFYQENPVWALNYSGIEINDKFSGIFLKKALSQVNKKMPYRGPKIFEEGEYLYICQVTGDFYYFQGKEEMYCNEELVYECYFHGGIVK